MHPTTIRKATNSSTLAVVGTPHDGQDKYSY
jgi:hypothetical protein